MNTKILTIIFILSGFLAISNTGYGCNVAPAADLDAVPEYVADGYSVTLDGSDSYDTDGTITKYEWDFTNNGSYDYNETSGSAGDGSFDGNTTHIYSSHGQYTAKLRVTDNYSATDTNTCTVYVNDTFYVDPDGNDTDNNGLSWAAAFATIQKGVDISSNGHVVEVNEGTYIGQILF